MVFLYLASVVSFVLLFFYSFIKLILPRRSTEWIIIYSSPNSKTVGYLIASSNGSTPT